jgi:hypothetical protein
MTDTIVDTGQRNALGQRIDSQGQVIPETGAGGISLGTAREIAGGGKITEHTPDPVIDPAVDALRHQRRYMSSRLAKEAGNIIGRSPADIGFFGKGDTMHGSGILIDVDTLEKHRFNDNWKFEGDELYANSRDLPHALVNDGELADNLSGKAAKAPAKPKTEPAKPEPPADQHPEPFRGSE